MGTTPAPEVVEGEVLPRTIVVGDTLRNGGVVLAVKPYVPGHSRDGLIVLALCRGEFVTWVSEADGSEAFWGHYFRTDLGKALADFEARK